MKKLALIITAVLFVLVGCESDPVEETIETQQNDIGNFSSVRGEYFKECLVLNVDRCPYGETQPPSNFWWPEFETDYFNPDTYFASTDEHFLVFTENEDGTATIVGSVIRGDCVVEINVKLKDRMSWAEWWAEGGGHKKEGCAGIASSSEDMSFYVIDSENSTLTASGGDCIAEGTFGLTQRPDPNDQNTPNYGAHVGAGGGNFDSETGAPGLSTWGWITDIQTGERLWVMDFNFKFDCEVEEPSCETAFARGDDGATCFIDLEEYNFNRWGWTIGPLSEGEYTYDIYAAAGQCDINKGTLVGTVDVSYSDGNVEVTYNIDDAYEVEETHTYAGNDPVPTGNNGRPTVAPGQYTIGENLEGEIYVIAHAVVCGTDFNGEDDEEESEVD